MRASRISMNFRTKVILCVLAGICIAFALLNVEKEGAFADEEKPDNGIPVVYITIDETEGHHTIEEMNSDPDHEVTCDGTMSIDVPDGFHYSDMQDKECESLSGQNMTIRGRGNTTWLASKKPYKVKLEEKIDIFGLGKNKHWVLLANSYDKTLIKDRITAWLGTKIGMEFTPRGVPVDLVMKNTEGTYLKYLGSYYLSENVRIDKNRVDIDELKEGDTGEPEITGGYLVQGGSQTSDTSNNYFTTKAAGPWAIKAPDFDDDYVSDAQKNYIINYMQEVEDAVMKAGEDNEDGKTYKDYIDIESAAKYWLIDAISMNGDGYRTGSTYLYKRRDQESGGVKTPGKLYFGPLWDFDFAWYYGDGNQGFELNHEWVKAMLYDKGAGSFSEAIKKEWPALKEALSDLTKIGGTIDKYYEETKASQAKDRLINPSEEGEGADSKDYDYSEEITSLQNWIVKRTKWIDQHLSEVDDLVKKVTYVAEGKEVAVKYMPKNYFLNVEVSAPEKEGYTFIGWKNEDGEIVDNSKVVDSDMTLNAYYIPDSEATHAANIFFPQDNLYMDINKSKEIQLIYSVTPSAAQDKEIKWSSSDETIATVNNNGIVRLLSIGEVEITASIKSGMSKKVKLIIKDGGFDFPNKVAFKESIITMKKGDEKQIKFSLLPEASTYDFITFLTGNENVATVDDAGVVKACGYGSTVINIIISDGKAKTLRAAIKISVPAKNTMTAKGRTVRIKRAKLKKKAQKIARKKVITVKKAKGKVTYTLTKVNKTKFKKYFKVAKKTGKITVKKKLKKGTYILRVRVTAAGNLAYKKKSVVVKVKIRVK